MTKHEHDKPGPAASEPESWAKIVALAMERGIPTAEAFREAHDRKRAEAVKSGASDSAIFQYGLAVCCGTLLGVMGSLRSMGAPPADIRATVVGTLDAFLRTLEEHDAEATH